jgi:hypothetical protein
LLIVRDGLSAGAFQELEHEKDDQDDETGFEKERQEDSGHVDEEPQKAEADKGQDAVDQSLKDGWKIEVHDGSTVGEGRTASGE